MPTLNEAVIGNQLIYRKSHLKELEKEYQEAGEAIDFNTTEQLKVQENDIMEQNDVVSALGTSTSLGRMKYGKL